MTTSHTSSLLKGIPTALIVGAATAICTGAVYQVLTNINPFVYVNLILTIAFASITGLVVGHTLERAGNESRFQAVATAAVAVTLGIAAGFIANFYLLAGDLAAEASDPVQAFCTFIDMRMEAGWEFSRRASTVSVDGNMVPAIWGAEWLLAVLTAASCGAGAVR